MRLVTSEQMRQLDARTIALGTPGLELMERAGMGVVERILARQAAAVRRGVLVVAGAGNNGGDGFVIARGLAQHGYRVAVALLADPEKIGGDAQTNLERWRRRRGKLLTLADRPEDLGAAIDGAGVVVDCLLGTGLRREVRGPLGVAIEAINRGRDVADVGRRAVVVAVDLPSGLDGDRGEPLGCAVRADLTVTLGAVKLGLVLPAARAWVGDLELVDIGIGEQAFAEIEPVAEAGDADASRALLPKREATSHKGTHGHLLVVAGSVGKSGAAILAGRAALRSGAGLVTVACPEAVRPLVAGALPELMTDGTGTFSSAEWHARLEGRKAVVVGPGLGTELAATRLVRWLVQRSEQPLVVDADGLNALAGSLEVLSRARGGVVLTPHPGEMARLVGATVGEVQGDRVAQATSLAKRCGAVVVLKGSGTVIAAPDGRLRINTSGGPILGTGGTGDVLSGLIGALLAQGLAPFEAACLGVYLHGLAGDRLARRLGDAGLLASELADEIPLARRELQEGEPRPLARAPVRRLPKRSR